MRSEEYWVGCEAFKEPETRFGSSALAPPLVYFWTDAANSIAAPELRVIDFDFLTVSHHLRKAAMTTANTAKHVPRQLVAQLATRRRAVCLRCQYRAIIASEGLVPSYSLTTIRGYASESTVQRWRKKLWGGKPAEQKEQPAVETEPEDDDYTPATTWDGLQRVGGRPSLEEFERYHRWEEGFVVAS